MLDTKANLKQISLVGHIGKLNIIASSMNRLYNTDMYFTAKTGTTNNLDVGILYGPPHFNSSILGAIAESVDKAMAEGIALGLDHSNKLLKEHDAAMLQAEKDIEKYYGSKSNG